MDLPYLNPFSSCRLRAYNRILSYHKECILAQFPCRRISCTQKLNNTARQNQNTGHINQDDDFIVEASPKRHNDTNTTSPSQVLPQSPLLAHPRDPRRKQPKRRAVKEDIDRLRRNPWAMALASPPRMCSVTNARLPRALLGDWGLIRRPNSANLWLMPVGLLDDELKMAAEKESKSDGQEDTEAHQEPKKQKPRPLEICKLRIADRLLLLKHCTAHFANSTKRYPLTRMIPFRWRPPHGLMTTRDMKNIVWREDMPSFALKHMRKMVMKELKKTCPKVNNSASRHCVWTTIELRENSPASLAYGLQKMKDLDNMECGGILIMGFVPLKQNIKDANVQESVKDTTIDDLPARGVSGSDIPSSSHRSVSQCSPKIGESRGTQGEVMGSAPPSSSIPTSSTSNSTAERSACSFSSVFPDFITLPQRGSKVPVFDLSALLTDSEREELRKHHPRFREAALFFLPRGTITTGAMLALWKLKGFVMYDEELLI